MARKRTIDASGVENMPLHDVYAEWGTTREDHLSKMKKFIERKNAEARKTLSEAPVVKMASTTAAEAAVVRPAAITAEAIKRAAQAVALGKAGAMKGRVLLTGSGKSYSSRGIVVKVIKDLMHESGTGVVGYVPKVLTGSTKKGRRTGIDLGMIKDAKWKMIKTDAGIPVFVAEGARVGKKGPKKGRNRTGGKKGGFRK